MGRLGTRGLARGVAAAALAAVVCAATGAAAAPGPASDVRLLAGQMEEIHPALYATVPKAAFRKTVDTLAARAPSLEQNELLVELMRLAALPGNGNGHGGIFPGDPQHTRSLHLYPIRLYTFADGTYVVDAKSGKLVGARIVAVAGQPYDAVAARVRPLVPRDNASSLRGLLPHYLLTAEVLDGLGVSDGVGPVELTFAKNGATFTQTLAPVTVRAYVSTFSDPHYGHYPAILPRHRPVPMYLAKLAQEIWLATIDRGRAVFVGYNAVQPIDIGFASRLLAAAKKPLVRRVVVDLRLNGGGDNTTFGTLVAALRDPAINRRGRLVVLIGRATFSAAANFAAELDRSTKARFVGEATGGGVKIYGDTVPVLLPASGVGARIPARYWDFGKGPKDRRLAVNPDVAVAPRSADFFSGRDPVLAKALTTK